MLITDQPVLQLHNPAPVLINHKRIQASLGIGCMACARHLATFRDTIRQDIMTYNLCLCPVCHGKPAAEVLDLVDDHNCLVPERKTPQRVAPHQGALKG